MHAALRFLLAAALCASLAPRHATVAYAIDVPIVATKLVIVDRTAVAAQAKAVFTAKDAAITKGAGTDPTAVSAVLGIVYDEASGQLAMPPGSAWVVNSASVAKYVNQAAPAGGAVKVGVVKPGTVLKVVGKSLGDDPIDISAAPSGTVAVAYVVTNGTETVRHCTAFAGCAHKSIAGGTGWKLVCKNGTGDASCAGAVAPVCGDGAVVAGESCDPPGASCGAGLLCDNACRCHLCGNGVEEEGEQCDDGGTVPGDGCDAVCQDEESVSGGGTVTTDGESDGATAADPVEATVTSPVGGAITILETSASGEAPAGLGLLGRRVLISAPVASAAAPLVLQFLLDATLLPEGTSPGTIDVFRAGVLVPACTGATGVAAPDPCVAARTAQPGGDVAITALTSQASPWGFGANVVLHLTTTPPGGTCGAVRAGGAGGTVVKNLVCGGLSVGGGLSTFVEAAFRAGDRTELNAACDDVGCTVTGRGPAETGDAGTCSTAGCPFGTYLPVANGGVSLCLRHEFVASAGGDLDHGLGSFVGSLPLASVVNLTANAAMPCPRCVAGTVGVEGSGTCDPTWMGGAGASADSGAACTPANAAGDNDDCEPSTFAGFPPVPLSLTPVTTGVASLSDGGGLFCPGQTTGGAFGCRGSGAPSPNCPGGNVPPVPDHVQVTGTPAGAITPGAHPIGLASAFCIPLTGNFLIDAAADLPGPGAFSLPATIEVGPATTSTSTTVVTTTSTTTTTVPPPAGLVRLRTGAPGGTCGAVRTGGAGGTVVKSLACGGISIGGGASTFLEAPMPGGGLTELGAGCIGSSCAIGALSAVDTGSNDTCSTTGCRFGPYAPVANGGISLCFRHGFTGPASGALDSAAGSFSASFPLSTVTYITGNAALPCPKCLAGTVGVVGSGFCDPTWTGGSGPSPDSGAACTPVNVAGDTYDCEPTTVGVLPATPLALTPTTGGASLSDAGGLFCIGQNTEGAFGCRGSGTANSNCPGGNVPPVPDYVGVVGTPAGTLTPGTHPITLASTFCIPATGNLLIDGAADLAGPGAASVTGTIELFP